MNKWNTIKALRRKSEIARIRANKRWEMDRRRRADLQSKDPAFTGLKIIRRIVVIDRESVVREATIYSTDSHRSASRKIKGVLLERE